MDNKPFSQEKINDIFRTSTKNPTRLVSRESSNLEFKASFGWKSLPGYLKSFASFANAKGGYLVFGVSNRPRKLVGLNGINEKLFEDIDCEIMTGNLNEYFSPEISYEIQEYELDQNTYGLIYIYESQDKPVMCKKNSENELKEGEIYYRYRARSERIKYPELREILEFKREKEQHLWMQTISRIAKIGVGDTGIFDLQTGQVTGSAGSFIIDESLLSQLSFIKEGEFSEIKGKPTLKLIGKVESISGLPILNKGKTVVKTKGIRVSDIILSFLRQEKVGEPKDYITQMCFEFTAFLPIYYYIRLGKLNPIDTIKLLNGVVCRSHSRPKLISRLESNDTQKQEITSSDTHPARAKRGFIQQLLQHKVDINLNGEDFIYCLQSIRGLTESNIRENSDYLRGVLQNWFNRHYSSADSSIIDNLRRAICWIDEALYKTE
jgi:hypothetical protein